MTEQQELLPGFPVITSNTIESSSGYLVRKLPKKRKVAHIWNGQDTACRQASTGGLDPSHYRVVSHIAPDESICVMCRNVTSGSSFGAGAQCNCGGILYERQEDNIRYSRCSSCGRVLAPHHPGRPESIVTSR